MDSRIREIKRLADNDRLDEARARADQLVADFPNDAEAWRCRSHIFALEGNHKEAVKDISTSIERNPNEPHYFWTRAKYLLELGDSGAAVEDLNTTLRLCDQHGSDYYREAAYLLRAEAYLRLKRFDDARRDCNNVRDDATLWIGALRSKKAILAECK